ncbi:hypothetical protein ACQPZQ_28720 [Pseudonocardia sp. CA-142604]|uniref:hypothetical protein n=1 Tax=Pseudonocardia sp. CA-142604 TaxID=3240024 RepID=UPI003D8F297E
MRNGSGGHGAGRHEVRTSDPVRLTRTATERLLDGGDGPAELRHLLDVAAGPGTSSELAGEGAALAAFVDAPRTASLPSHLPRRTSMLSTVLSKILAAKAIAAIALVAGATGGIALAAQSTGVPEDRPAAGAHTSTEGRPSAPAETARPDGSDRPAGAAGQAGGQSDPATGPSLAGLCHAWTTAAADDAGKAAESQAFTALVDAAGDPDAVAAYCADMHSTSASGQSGNAPGRSESAPGHTGTASDSAASDGSGTAPGHSGSAPGQAHDPSRSDRSAGGPGRADDEGDKIDKAQKPDPSEHDASNGAKSSQQ